VQMRGATMLFFLQKKYDVNARLVCPPGSKWEYIRFAFLILKLTFYRKKYIKVVIQQVIDQSFYAKMLLFLSRQRKDIVYDVDYSVNHLKKTHTYNAFLNSAKTVVSGSQWVQNAVQKTGVVSYYLPTPVQAKEIATSPKNIRLTIGWIADCRLNDSTDETLSNLNVLNEMLIPVLKELNFPIKLELIGLRNAKDRNQIREAFRGYHLIQLSMPTEACFTEQLELQERIENWDLALSPSSKHLFNLSCASHLTQLILSAGVPLIVSNVGEHAKLIRNGENGWKCDSVSEFTHCAKIFINLSNEQQQKMREEALKSVACRDISSISERFAEWVLSGTVQRSSSLLGNSELV
jgi:glycosyltransferase involved in cell wall biosynthesis